MLSLCLGLIAFVLASSMSVQAEDVTQEIIARCRTQWPDEPSMVKYCVDQDINALRALNTYSEKHHAIISRCRTQWPGEYKMVKYCADRDIAAEEALSGY